MSKRSSYIAFHAAVLVGLAAVLSHCWRVPYFVTALGILVWSTLGHLATLDDDMPGGWSNPEGSRPVWRRSLKELGVKLLAIVAIFVVVACFPALRELGA